MFCSGSGSGSTFVGSDSGSGSESDLGSSSSLVFVPAGVEGVGGVVEPVVVVVESKTADSSRKGLKAR